MDPSTVEVLNRAYAHLAIDAKRAAELAAELKQHQAAAEKARRRAGFDADPADFRALVLGFAGRD